MSDYDPNKIILSFGGHRIEGFGDAVRVTFGDNNPHQGMLEMKFAILGNKPVTLYICGCSACLANLELTKQQQKELRDL